jgi:hypothetical protein
MLLWLRKCLPLFFLGLFSLSLVLGCSSLKSKAKDFLQAGAYDQAVSLYQSAVEKDPSDVEARAGLQQARTLYIDKKLIETRMARLSGNPQNAMDLLLDIVQKEKLWQFAPVGQVASTQEEETGEALRFLAQKSQQSVATDRPLVALYYFKHYGPIFETSPGAYSASLKRMQVQGYGQCASLGKLREKSRPYFAQFVQRLCAQWGREQKDLKLIETEIAKTLFSGFELKNTMAHLDAALKSEFHALLQQTFRETSWYHPNAAATLPMQIEGTYNQQHSQTPETLIHNYSVMEPYTAYEPVKKRRTVPYPDSQMNCFYDSKNQQQCATNPVTRYREEEYTETEPLTRYREVPRTFPYTATYHRQILEVAIDSKVKFPAEMLSVAHQDKAERVGHQHHLNRPDIGLKPAKPDLLDTNAWFRDQAKRFSEKVRTSADEYWVALYCKPSAGAGSLAATGEQALRCLANKSAGAPAFAEQWYQTHFGITLAQARELGL